MAQVWFRTRETRKHRLELAGLSIRQGRLRGRGLRSGCVCLGAAVEHVLSGLVRRDLEGDLLVGQVERRGMLAPTIVLVTVAAEEERKLGIVALLVADHFFEVGAVLVDVDHLQGKIHRVDPEFAS